MPAARETTLTLRQKAEQKLSGELVKNGMHPVTAAQVAAELVAQGLTKAAHESGSEIGFLSQIDEAGFAVLENVGFGNALNVATKVTGQKPASATVGAAANKPEAAAVKGTEKAGAAIPSIVSEIGELIATYGLRLGEVLAGAVLILFGLVTLAGGKPSTVAKAAALA